MIARLLVIGALLLGGAVATLKVIEGQFKVAATEVAEVAPRDDGCYTDGGSPR